MPLGSVPAADRGSRPEHIRANEKRSALADMKERGSLFAVRKRPFARKNACGGGGAENGRMPMSAERRAEAHTHGRAGGSLYHAERRAEARTPRKGRRKPVSAERRAVVAHAYEKAGGSPYHAKRRAEARVAFPVWGLSWGGRRRRTGCPLSWGGRRRRTGCPMTLDVAAKPTDEVPRPACVRVQNTGRKPPPVRAV